MFDLKSYINFKTEQYNINDKTYTIPIYIDINTEKITEDTLELKEALMNLRKIFNKNYTIVVTKTKIRLFSEE